MNMKPTDRNPQDTHPHIRIYWYILGILYWWKSKSISSDSRQSWRFLSVLSCSYCKLSWSWSCLGLCLRPIRQISLPDCELHEYGRRLASSTRSPLVNVLACSGFMRLPVWVCVCTCVWGCFKLQLIYVNGFAKYLQHFGERYDDDY